MAEKKTTTKKTAVKPAKTVQTVDELKASLDTKQQDLLQARRGLAAGELANPRVITTTKKEIARLHTAIRASELSAAKETK